MLKQELEEGLAVKDIPDITLVASLLMTFFAELKEPVIPKKVEQKLIDAESLTETESKYKMMHSLLLQLPGLNRSVLLFMMRSIASLAKCNQQNNNDMNAISHLCSYFGPLFFHPNSSAQNIIECGTNAKDMLPLITSTMVTGVDALFEIDSPEIKYIEMEDKIAISEATIDKQIDMLTDPWYEDPDFASIFFLYYSYFISSIDLLKRFIQIFQDASTKKDKIVTLNIRLRILLLMNMWFVESASSLNLDKNFVNMFQEFVSDKLATEQEKALGSELVSVILSATPETVYMIEMLEDQKMKKLDKAMFTSHGPSIVDIVRHLTLVDSEYFTHIKKKELINKAWLDAEKSPYWLLMTEQFNQLCLWCQTCILKEKDLGPRRQILCCFVEMAWQCVECGSFNSALAIFTGLNAHPIQRQKKTWRELPKKTTKTLEMLETVFDLRGNYVNYREKLKNTSPAIPCLSIISKDLFVVEENIPTFTESGLINFAKLRRIYHLTSTVLHYQQEKHRFKKFPELFAFFAHLRGYEQEDINFYAEVLENK